jgi:sugar lactone lactonase YvrE
MTVPEAASWPGHDGGAWAPAPSRIVASWPAGYFAENVAVADDGTVFVSLHSHNRIDRYRPDTGELDVFCQLPAPPTGLAFDAAGGLWVTGGEVGRPPGYVWRVSQEGEAQAWLEIADALFLNGCALLSPQRTLLVAESFTGRLLAVALQAPAWSSWVEDGSLRPGHEQMPGANGLKIHGDWIWVSVTDHDTILRVPVGADGTAGQLELVAEHLRADDFAFAESGALYIATHVAQTVVRLASDGTRTTIAGPAEGAVGSTACAFGRAAQDRQALYVTTNGGLTIPYEGKLQEAKLLRLEVGEAGLSLPGGRVNPPDS